MTRGDLLGWQPFRELLARFAATPFGRDSALSLAPSSAVPAIRAALAETTEARHALTTEGPPPFTGLVDIRSALDEASPAGAMLDGPTLATLSRTLETTIRLGGYGVRVAGVAPGLGATLRALPPSSALAQALARALDADGRLLDDASPRLRTLRRQLVRLRADLEMRLERLLDSPGWATALQERYVTVRNGRYVVPVRDDARRLIRGIVHDRSQSGVTVFVEPEAVIELNNELIQGQLEERDETARILTELTAQVRACLPDLEGLVTALGVLDLAFARAALAERLRATEPIVEATGDLDLRAARHPLLVAQGWSRTESEPVIAVDLVVPASRPGLVISGPNAGGKTVALETCGLLVLMAQAGCHIPAAPGSRLAVCDQVLAVIGDEQSLAQNLSTFSSFVAQIREILDVAGPGTLVLLDELGAGTDPSEGAALGQALLEALLDRGSRVVATTHLEPIKVFAQTEPRLANATVAFDTERLEPAFRLEYGHPGPSFALTIGARLGLPPTVIARARAHLSEESRRLDALLADLARREREADVREAAARQREAEATAALARAREAALAAERDAAGARRDAHAEARAVLAEARRRVGAELDRLRGEETSRRRTQDAYHRLRAAEAELPAPDPDAAPIAAPATGDVQLRGLGLRGRIVGEDGDMVTVQAGRLTVRVTRDQLEAAPEGAPPPRPASVSVPVRDDVPDELQLLGLAADEARAAVEKFLDDAILAGHGTVRLVHGKGTGTLKRAVELCLRAHPLVASFRTADPAAGGAGATVVQLHEGQRGEDAAGARRPAAGRGGSPARRRRDRARDDRAGPSAPGPAPRAPLAVDRTR
ncbi:MAG: endonuclease MutS2 [Candidatus Rokuibacteriota bacterium]|nr:MAG: endonuclease MutS2 [Candidatus Rokubacteria bacterium]